MDRGRDGTSVRGSSVGTGFSSQMDKDPSLAPIIRRKTKPHKTSRHQKEAMLQRELERMKAKLGLGGALTVAWHPREGSEERGRVVGDTMEIFTNDLEDALKTLRHEFVEYVLTREFLEPRLFEAKLHKRADALVDALAKLL